MKPADFCTLNVRSCRPQGKIHSLLLILIWMIVLAGGARTNFVQAAPPAAVNPYDLIAAVNQLRAANGLPQYTVNSALMAAAQAHSEYQASIGQGTHTGAGGSRPRDRAAAAGYGGGAAIFVSENIAWGSSMTAQSAVAMWQGDSLHLNTMLGSEYTDVGAGVATAGGVTYLTLDVGYVAGSPGSGAANPTGSAPAAATADFNPVITATPNPDGSIIHIVEPGQTLWTIAVIYQVPLDELKRLNGLTLNTIYAGQKLVIRPAGAVASATPAPAAGQLTSTPTRPIPTPLPTATPLFSPTPLATPLPAAEFSPRPSQEAVLIPIIILIIGGLLLIILGRALSQRT